MVEWLTFSSVEQARDWLLERIQIVHLAGNLDLANYIANGVYLAQQRTCPLPGSISVDLARFQSRMERLAPAKSRRDDIYINPNSPFWADMDTFALELGRRGDWSTGEGYHVLIHEIGHVAHYRLNPQAYTQVDMDVNQLTLAEMRLITKHVSNYAATHQKELVAEVFAGRFFGKRYLRSIMNMYRRFGGPEI